LRDSLQNRNRRGKGIIDFDSSSSVMIGCMGKVNERERKLTRSEDMV
jgi:hypothetical protein